jgi:hypothetical protein
LRQDVGDNKTKGKKPRALQLERMDYQEEFPLDVFRQHKNTKNRENNERRCIGKRNEMIKPERNTKSS